MSRDPVTLASLAARLGVPVTGDGSVVVADVHHDSRAVTAGTLFVAIRGFSADGHDFVPRAEEAGAVALIVEHPVSTGLPYLVVPDARKALPVCAALVHGHPAERLTTIGVTGTNGKTTVTYLLEAILTAAGRRAAVLGTVGARIAGRPVATARTTPESSDLQRLLAGMARADIEVVALEVSSHALTLGRVDAIRFDVAAFTNLSRDHLDFHGTMDDYFEAKAVLFSPDRSRRAVINVDDPWGRRLRSLATVPTTTVGADGDIAAEDVRPDPEGTTFLLRTGVGSVPVRLAIPGAFNATNAAVAAACALGIGIDLADVAAGLGAAAAPPGRFQRVDGGRPFAVIVDYAHTPDAVTAAIGAAREMASGRVIAVLGAGGDRDRDKRPAMGAALAGADLAVVTADNPRSEDPAAISAAVVSGAAGGRGRLVEIPDRRVAIEYAVNAAAAGDVVLILGKGHERGQEIAGRIVPFDDAAVAGAAAEART